MTPALTLLLYALLGSVAGLVGGLVLIFYKKSAGFLTKISLPLAAGVLLSLSLLDLFPEATEEIGPLAFSIVLAVFVVLYLIERFVTPIHHHEDGHIQSSTVSFVIFGDTIHNFLDGVAIAASFLVAPSLGLLVALGTFLHETPHEIADFAILIRSGFSKSRAFWTNFFSALATIPGAFLTFYYAERVEGGIGILLAIAAGLFLYVSSTDFLPELTHEHERRGTHWEQTVFLLVGVFAVVIIRLFIPEVGH